MAKANNIILVSLVFMLCLFHHTNAVAFIQKQLTFDNCGMPAYAHVT